MADADFTTATGGSSSRTLTTAAGKTDSSANADSGATPDLPPRQSCCPAP
jgi:hypothetical protein